MNHEQRALREFLQALSGRPDSPGVQNPYRLPGRADNLRAYMEAMLGRRHKRILLVGEAPGYRGCLLTGIPFSSPELLRRTPHHFLRGLKGELQLAGRSGEATASIVWQALEGRRAVPLFWNSFPFHPHRYGEPQSNRSPSADELAEGLNYLRALADIYRPQLIAGVGEKGAEAAARAFPGSRVLRIRHPSYGGKREFTDGMTRLYRLRINADPG